MPNDNNFRNNKAPSGREASVMGSVWSLLIAGATMGIAALLAFLWGVKNGVFENSEDAKYIVFRDEDDED